MPKILIVDTLYPDFLRSLPFDPHGTYDAELQKVLNRKFGTSDFWSRHLRALGWDVRDILVNHHDLQNMWANENYGGQGRRGELITDLQVEKYRPDVIFLQDVSCVSPAQLKSWSGKHLLAAQISCPMPPHHNVQWLDCVMTSFPHYVKQFEECGIKAAYLPLAFEDSLAYVKLDTSGWLIRNERVYDCVFIGGVGNPSHWKRGMETLEAVAREIPTFKWWGYGESTLPANSALRSKYQGPAFGSTMYEIFSQSRIVLNRHGEVAQGYANNMRLFESTGMGAMLLTEDAPNLKDFFADNECTSYSSPSEAAYKVNYFLNHPAECAEIAAKGQARTLRDHTYQKRMAVVSDVLKEML